MPRKNRIIYDGAIYHVYQRGNNKEHIFRDNETKIFILKQLKEYNKKFDYEILAYVIMDNHYHLLIKTNESPISDIMFYFDNVLGKYVNTKLGRTGHAFEDRYKCIPVETDAYLIWLLRYIHRNPVKAHICCKAEEYKWSSHCFYKYYISTYINTSFIFCLLGSNKKSAMEQYFKLVNSPGDENDIKKDYEIIKTIFKPEEASLLSQNTSQNHFIKPIHKTLNEVIKELNISEDTLNDIRNGKRKQNLTPIKFRIAIKAIEECYSLKEIADYLNVVPSAISKLLSRNEIT